jgi:hypothetical protein
MMKNNRTYLSETEEVDISFDEMKRNELLMAEKVVKIAKKNMLNMLAEFKSESSELRRLKDQKNEE